MPKLTNARHEAFAVLIAEGVSRQGAYHEVYGSANKHSASNCGAALAQQPKVADRIIELQQQGAQEAVWTLTERLAYLRDVAMTSYGAVDDASPLCVGTRHKVHGVEYQTPDKLEALALYSRLVGDFDRESHEPAPTPLGELMDAIRTGGPTPLQRLQQASASNEPGTPLTNSRHERFAQHIVSGETQISAMIKAYNLKIESARGSASRLAGRPEIMARIAELRETAAANVGWTFAQRLLYLKRLVQTPLRQITSTSRYCQGVLRNPRGESLRIPNKLRALALYTQLTAQT